METYQILYTYTINNNIWLGKDIINIIIDYAKHSDIYKHIKNMVYKNMYRENVSVHGLNPSDKNGYTDYDDIIIHKFHYKIVKNKLNHNSEIIRYLTDPPDNIITITRRYENKCYIPYIDYDYHDYDHDRGRITFYFNQDSNPDCIILKIYFDSDNNIYLRVC